MSDTHSDTVDTSHPVVVSAGRLWFVLLAPPAVWIAQGLTGWFFGARMCTSMSVPDVRVVVTVASLAALGTALGAMVIGWQNWRRTSPAPARRHFAALDRVDFMAACGFLLSGLFVLGIFWAGLSGLLIDVCGSTR